MILLFGDVYLIFTEFYRKESDERLFSKQLFDRITLATKINLFAPVPIYVNNLDRI